MAQQTTSTAWLCPSGARRTTKNKRRSWARSTRGGSATPLRGVSASFTAGCKMIAAMEPRIQYAKTSDGVSIAYWVLGKGMPLVYASSPPFNHLQMEWQIPQLRLLFERLARGRMLVKYDHRGCGLS